MNLKIYLYKNEITRQEFATWLGISMQYLNHLINGVSPITHRMAMQIEALTNGEVTYYKLTGKKRPRKTAQRRATRMEENKKNAGSRTKAFLRAQ